MNAPVKIEAASLHSAMAAAFAEIEAATKSANNPHFKSKYADISAVIDAVKPALIRHGLFFTQHPQPSEDGVTVETLLHHASGESMSLGSLYLPANKRDAQGFGSALTYARRYALQTAFGVPTEDDDGNAASRAVAGQSQTGTVSQQQPKRGDKHSALQRQVREFVHTMEGCGDWDEWIAFRDLPDSQKLIAEVREKLPQWWEGGPDMPAEFVPLRRRIELLEANMANRIADIARV